MSALNEVSQIENTVKLLKKQVVSFTGGKNLLFDSFADACRREAKRSCHSKLLKNMLESVAHQLDLEGNPYTVVDVIDERK